MAKPTACIFTLNSKHEPRAFKNYFEKQGVHVENPVSTDPSKKTDITELFKRFVEQKANSGEKCDLITISGHHSGSFWGDNTFGQLDLKSIYEMSCNPKYKDFFNNIKAWWLLGCQTDGLNVKSAESEAERLMQECAQDPNPQYCDFSNNLILYGGLFDSDTNYLSSLQAISPKAYMFAYTKKAPLDSQSLDTFEVQFEKTASLLQQELKASTSAQELSNIVVSANSVIHKLLSSNSDRCQNCSTEDEALQKAVVKGWESHLGARYQPNAMTPLNPKARQCSYDNKTLLAQKDILASIDEKELAQCHHNIDCLLMNQIEGLQCKQNKTKNCKNTYDRDTSKALLDIITNSKNKKAISLLSKSFNNVEALIRELRRTDPGYWKNTIRPMLQDNYKGESVLKRFFERKISPTEKDFKEEGFVETTSLRKMAIYTVEKAILEGASAEVVNKHRNNIITEVKEILGKENIQKIEFAEYRQELIRSLYYSEILDVNNLTSELPPGIDYKNGEIRVKDSSQLVGIIEHLSNTNIPDLTEGDRQKILVDLMEKLPSSELDKLSRRQKVDYNNAFDTVYDSELVRKRNKIFMQKRSSQSVWGIGGFLETASGSDINKVVNGLDGSKLGFGEKLLLIRSLPKMLENPQLSQSTPNMGRLINSVRSDSWGAREDAILFAASNRYADPIQRVTFQLHLKEKIKSGKRTYTKNSMDAYIDRLSISGAEKQKLKRTYSDLILEALN